MIRLLLLLAVTLPAWAQQGQTPPAEPKKEKEAERRPLNLRLDNPSSFATIAPAEKEAQKALPTLGGDARKMDPAPLVGTRSEGGPYPKDGAPTGH